MSLMRKILAGAAVAGVLSAGVFSGAAQAEKWDMPTPYGEKLFHTANIIEFAKDVKAATGGALEIKVHAGGALIKHPEIKNAVRGGQVPIGEFLLSRLSNENGVFGVDSVPFLATDYASAEKLWAASRPVIEKLLDKQGLQILFAVPWPPQGVYSKKPVNSVADMKGVKFRAYNAATERLAQLMGAVPTQVEVPDIPQAFATGRVEAMITSPSTGANSKAWDFVNYFYHTQAWLPKNVVVVNKRAFSRLDKSVQEAVLKAAATAEARGWEASKAETKAKMDILSSNGMTVSAPSAQLASELKAIGATMTEEWETKSSVGAKVILDSYNK